MTEQNRQDEYLDLADIQGNVVRAYGRFRYPFARYFFLNISDPAKGREFVDAIRKKVTTAQRWKRLENEKPISKPGDKDVIERPKVTLNIAFTFRGLVKLQLPTRTLQSMPPEYIDGMRKRAHILGDVPVKKAGEDGKKPESVADHTAGWDPIWQESHKNALNLGGEKDVHIWISMNAQLKEQGKAEAHGDLENETEYLKQLCEKIGGVKILTIDGKEENGQEYQEANAVFTRWPDNSLHPTHKEHFGFADGIGDPVFEGQYPKTEMGDKVVGRGKWMDGEQKWKPLAAGEFILGYPDESQELPPTAAPINFMNNGTFMVYRKLHENVAAFERVIDEEADTYLKTMGINHEDEEEQQQAKEEARITLKAKIVGRWPDGVPLSTFKAKVNKNAAEPTETYDRTVADYKAWRAFRKERGFDMLGQPEAEHATTEEIGSAVQAYEKYFKSQEIRNFRYSDDMEGYKCPVSSHLRRTNTRDYLDPLNPFPEDRAKRSSTSQLNKRRRILRRGLPYGGPALTDKAKQDNQTEADNKEQTEQGVIFMAICGSIFRQFEFIQQQWIQYGLDFNVGNNTCPLLGNHEHHKRYTIASDPDADDPKPPFIMSKLETFVETRGGDYFFIPSITALRMIGKGIVDPT